MTLSLTSNATSSLPIELEGFTPDWARDKSLREIEQFPMLHGNQKLPLGEMFRVKGKPGDAMWEFDGDLSAVHRIGAGMRSGAIRIHGPAGRHVGGGMRGGEIHVEGNAGDFLGAEMRGGLIHIQGNAGNLAGAAYRGASRGMTGGTILVAGDAGNEVGAAIRRGIIAIGGNAGNLVACNMLAGTVLVLGECGVSPGAGIRRGTLGLFGHTPPALPASFRYACTARPTVLALLLRELEQRGWKASELLTAVQCDVYNGDFFASGRGEILVRHAA